MSTPQTPDGSVSTRAVRIAAVVGGAVLIAGLAVAVGTAGGKKPAAAPTSTAPAAPSPVTSAPQAPPAASSPVPSPASSSPSPAASAVVRWHGTLTISGPDAHRDLDVVPPRTDTRDADLTGDWLQTIIKVDGSNVQVAVSTRGPRPGWAQCRDAVLTSGSTDETSALREGDVLCVHTSQGRIARLSVVYATQTSTDPIVRVNAVIWDPPV